MRIKPARPGLLVRDPVSKRPLPDSGRDVPETSYWLRRLAAGDVIPAMVQADPIPDSEGDAQ